MMEPEDQKVQTGSAYAEGDIYRNMKEWSGVRGQLGVLGIGTAKKAVGDDSI